MMRGSIATLLLVAIVVYALQVLIVQPLAETEVLPVEHFRSFNLTQDFPLKQGDVTFNVIVVCQKSNVFFCLF